MEQLLFVVGVGVGLWYMASASPAPTPLGPPTLLRQTDGARDVDDEYASGHQPTVGVVRDVDSQTGLPFAWILKANGTKSKTFLDSNGVKMNSPVLVQP